MDRKEFEVQAPKVLDWMIDYQNNVADYDVLPQTQPGDILNQLPLHAPLEGEVFDTLFNDFKEIIMPGMTHWQHPQFFGYFPANISPPSLLAEMLVSTLGAQCMSWATSPAATELEERVMVWIQEALGLPEQWQGVIQDTASTATLCALLTARERATGFESNQSGLYNQEPFIVYCSAEAHSSIEKAMRIAGLGADNLRKIEVDSEFSLCPDHLEKAVQADLASGLKPLCVVGAFGTTGSTGIDPLAALGQICEKYQLWFHVDGAYAGSALILPELRSLAKGLEMADSFVFNPHKWLFTHFDCSAYFVKDAKLLTRTFELTPEYLKTEQDQQVNNYRDWGIQLGRRFRALKLWFVLRSYGIHGLQAKIRTHLEFSRRIESRLEATPHFEILAPVNFNTLCFRFQPEAHPESEWDAQSEALLQRLNQSGQVFMTHTKLNGKFAIRWVIGQTHVSWESLDESWTLLQTMAEA